MAAAREGTFAIETTGDLPAALASSVGAHGNLVVTMDTPRTFRSIRLSAGLSGLGGGQGDLNLSAAAELPPGGGDEKLTVSVARGSRPLVTITTHLPGAKGQIEGLWTIDVHDPDLVPFAAGHALVPFAATGHGNFDSDLAFKVVHVNGQVRATARDLAPLMAVLGRAGTVVLDSDFDLTQSEGVARIASLSVGVSAPGPVLEVHALEAFGIDERTGELRVPDSGPGWLGVSVKALPLAWLMEPSGSFAFSGGEVKGEVVITPSSGGFSVRPKGSVTASSVSISREGRMLAEGLDLSLVAEADLAAKSFEIRSFLLVASRGLREIARFKGNASHAAGDDQPLSISGTWKADIDGVSSAASIALPDVFAGGSASGDFTAIITDSTDLQGNLLISAKGAGRSISSAFHVGFEGAGSYSFVVPIKLTNGSASSDIDAEGTWVRARDDDQVDLKITGASVSVEDLLLVAGPLASAGSGSTSLSGGKRDSKAFWGDWTGHVGMEFGKLRTQGGELAVVGGGFDLDHGSIHLNAGHGGPEHHDLTNISGSLTFDRSADEPYGLKATSAPFEVEAKTLFKGPHSDEDPVFEGRFSVAPALVGSGVNLPDLVARTLAEFRITSSVGIVRLLRANVAASLHERAAPVADTIGTLGTAVGGFLGVRPGAEVAAKNPVSKGAEATLDLANQLAEIGCDQITVVARRSADGAFQVSQIDMVAPDEFLRGTGEVTPVKGLSLFDQPLSFDLQIGAKGRVAQLLAKAGLADPKTDPQGFTLVNQTVHFGGTLAHIDSGAWQDLLVRAANRSH